MTKVLPEFKLVPEPQDEPAKSLTFNEWSPDFVGNRNKIGGIADYIQKMTTPKCKSCGEDMSFYGQLDSLNDCSGEFDIADCGMIYVFFCFDCNDAQAIVQSA